MSGCHGELGVPITVSRTSEPRITIFILNLVSELDWALLYALRAMNVLQSRDPVLYDFALE